MTIKISHIVAMSENRVIGAMGDMPWRISEDFKFFKSTTMGRAIIMGRKTYESIGRPLPGRLNIVITRNTDYAVDGVMTFSTIDAAIDYVKAHKDQWGEEIFIAGGGEVYKQTLPIADRIYLTKIHKKVEGDTFYPEFNLDQFTVVSEESRQEPEAFTWYTLDRIH
jgi:dihydrofolate reductase